MSKKSIIGLIILAFSIVSACSGLKINTERVDRIDREYLRSNLDNPDFVIIDVRLDSNWEESEFKIKGAVREDFFDVASWAHKYSREKTLVLYCA